MASPVPGQRGERCGGAGLGWRAFPGEKTLRNFLAQNWPRLLFLKPKVLGPAGMAPEGAVEGAAPARPPGTNATAFPGPVQAQLSPHKHSRSSHHSHLHVMNSNIPCSVKERENSTGSLGSLCPCRDGGRTWGIPALPRESPGCDHAWLLPPDRSRAWMCRETAAVAEFLGPSPAVVPSVFPAFRFLSFPNSV